MAGRLVTIEGLDGAGKTTLAAGLVSALAARGVEAVLLREPGGVALSERIRALVKDPALRVGGAAEALLYAAARAQLVEERVRPLLDDGSWVLLDRFVDSSLAYQGAARGLGVDRVRELNRFATGGLVPDRTLLLALDPAVGRARLAGRGEEPDRLEAEDAAFFARVAAAYADLAREEPERIRVHRRRRRRARGAVRRARGARGPPGLAYGRSGRVADHELHGQDPVARPLALQPRVEQLERRRAEALRVGRDGRERRERQARQIEVVEADDGQLTRDVDALGLRGREHARRDDVVVAEDGSRVGRGVASHSRAASIVALAVNRVSTTTCSSGSSPLARRCSRQRTWRRSNVSPRIAERSSPIRRCPSSCRCASASSVPDSTSRRTFGSPSASDSTTTTGGAPGSRSEAGGSAAKNTKPSIAPCWSVSMAVSPRVP